MGSQLILKLLSLFYLAYKTRVQIEVPDGNSIQLAEQLHTHKQ